MMNKVEPSGPEYALLHTKEWFQKARWLNFIKKFSGYNYGAARAFAQYFDGK
jgi:hypothetical protein